MIPYNFEYYKPSSVEEAVNIFQKLNSHGKEPLYYGGGTEIISMARRNDIHTKAVIDIKGIPECNTFEIQGDKLIVGSAVTLTGISEANLFPLLSKASSGTADHTIRNKITIGGNICGRIIYREAVLPFLLCDSTVIIAGSGGIRRTPINEAFNKTLKLGTGEFLVSIETDKYYISLPYVNIKKTRLEEIDYPLVSISALKKDGFIRIAFSGACPYPFRSSNVEEDLNNRLEPVETRIKNAIGRFPCPVMGGISGSAEYREFVIKNALFDILKAFEVM